MATHSSILAWRIPWTAEPGQLQSIGSQRVRHDRSNLACTGTHIYLSVFDCGGSWLLRGLVSSCSTQGRLSGCGARLLVVALFLVSERRLQAHRLQQLCVGLVALQHVGSFWTRDRIWVSWIGGRIPIHYTTREVPLLLFSCLHCSLQAIVVVFIFFPL